MVLTDGKNYASVLYLAEGDDGSAWTPITREEYEARAASPQAAENDYREALGRMGVRL